MRIRKWLVDTLLGRSSALAIIAVAAFLTRLIPIHFSQYPFNNDSLTDIRTVGELIESGRLGLTADSELSIMNNVATPAFDVVFAFFASLLGVDPAECGQLLSAVIATSTVGLFYLLGRKFAGDPRGGVAAAFAALLFGSFVFTTGSVWKMMLAMNLFLLLVLAYTGRSSNRYMFLTFIVLLVMPLVHHLATAISLLLLAYLLVWSWFYAVVRKSVKKRHVVDLLCVAIPGALAAYYYSYVELDRLVQFSSAVRVLVLILGFAGMSIMTIVMLSRKKHFRWTLAPLVGGGLVALLLLDYYGYLFPYEPSASDVYLVLVLATGFVVALGWYGAEVVVERRPQIRAVHVALFIAPITIVGFAFSHGLSLLSHQILYRSFDFLDVFLFLGVGVALAVAYEHRKRLYPLLGTALIAALVLSFPFGYWSSELLGVRHDTQAYELDALTWIDGRDRVVVLITDERLSYIARNMVGLKADPSLPYFIDNYPEYRWYYVLEDSWTTLGVNYYPHGRFVLSEEEYEENLAGANVFYIGGPSDDRIIMFYSSIIGGSTIGADAT